MINYETFCKIKHCYEKEHLNVSQIATACGLDERTVAKWLGEPNYRRRKSALRPSKLDPHKPYILSLIEKHPYSGQQILQRLRDEGYEGGYTIVKDYLQKVRPRRAPAYLTLSFAPGECAQVDWGNYGTVNVGSTTRKLSFFVMVLCYSRLMYLEFTVLQTMEHFLGCHQNAFDYFGGRVPENIMVDNLKSAVLKRMIGEAPVFNPRYLDFANHYGFTIKPCRVGKGNEKGRVESGVKYVKQNFLNGLDISDFSALHPAARQWLEGIANVRIHGETKKRPLDLFKAEKPVLKPVPVHPYDIGTVHFVRATSRFRVAFDSNRYSVPAEYASSRLTLKAYPERICIYSESKLIARHLRSYDRHQDFEDPDHPKQLLLERRNARKQKLYSRFLTLSPKAEAYYKQLTQRRFNAHHHIQKIVALSEIYGSDKVALAIEDAFTFKAFSSEYIANILEQRTRKLPEPGALHLTRRHDLLELDIPHPDLSVYENKQGIEDDNENNA